MTLRDTKRTDYQILGLILVLAAVLRFYRLDAPLWHDEIYTVLFYIRTSFADLVSNFGFNNHVFYSLQSKAMVTLFGETNWALRFPAVFFGIAGIAAMWWLAKLVAGHLQAHVTALLMALSYHHVWFSQNARGYTEIAFFCTLATIFFISGIRDPKWRTWIYYALSIAAAMYTHLTAGFLVAAHGTVYAVMLLLRLLNRNADPSSLVAPSTVRENFIIVAGFAVGGFLTLVLYAPTFMQVLENVMGVSGTSGVDVMKEYQNPLWTIFEALRTVAGNGPAVAVVGIGVFVALAFGSVSLYRRDPIFSVIVWVHIPLTLTVLVVLGMRVWPRFFFVDIGFLFLLITQGVFVICQFASQRAEAWFSWRIGSQRLFAFSVVLMAILSIALVTRNYLSPKQDLEGAYHYVEANRNTGDTVITLGQTQVPFKEYYLADWSIIESQSELMAIEKIAVRTWVVVALPARTFRKYDDIMSDVDTRYALEQRFKGSLGDGNVLVYRSPAK